MNLILRKLNINDRVAFEKALQQWDSSPGFLFAQGYQPEMLFEDYIELLDANERGEKLPEGYVPATILCGFVGSDLVGRISIRHYLNDFLFKIGGNIGYGVLPAHRRKGYAKEMLAQALDYARDLGLVKVLLTCDDENVASALTIERSGGRSSRLAVDGS